jgi:large repetitive protein
LHENFSPIKLLADCSGDWILTLSPALGEGTYSFSANATDTAGNPGPESDPAVVVTVDTTAPAAPVITDPVAGTQNTEITTITGTAEADATVPVFDGTTSLGTTTADSSGDWTLTLSPALGEGTYSFTANATDTAGNPGPASDPAVVVTVDTTIAAPVITDPVAGTQTTSTTIDTSMSLKISGNKATPGAGFTASGKLIDAVADAPIAGQEISVTINGLSPVTATTDNKGQFSVQLTAPSTNGDHDIQAHFAATSEYESSDSKISKLTVQGGTSLALTTTSATDTSLTLKV